MTRALALALLFAAPAHAAGNAPGAHLSAPEPQGRPVVIIQDVLLRVRPGDDMAVVLGVFIDAGGTPGTPPDTGYCSPITPCCPGCGATPQPQPPTQPPVAPIPLPPSGLMLLAALAALIWKGKRT